LCAYFASEQFSKALKPVVNACSCGFTAAKYTEE